MNRRKQTLALFSVTTLLLVLGLPIVQSVKTQTEQNTAEIGVSIDDVFIPGIRKNWTAINLTIEDDFGMNWNWLKGNFSNIQMRLIWPIMFGIPDLKRYLGYTSIAFIPEFPVGWSAQVLPASINQTTQGDIHKIKLLIQVTELASEYNPTIKVKCIRYDALGGEYGYTYISLPVKAVSLNYAFLNPLESTKKAAPKSIVYFPIEVTNKGEYRDTYIFTIKGEMGTYGLADKQSLILDAGETTIVQLGVMTPEVFYDIGTPRRIDISISPLGDPSEKFQTSIVVITEGFYISPLISFVLGAIIILALITYFLFFYLREKRERERYGKPEKPWKIPEERQHLKELKQDDKQAYGKERMMMEDEYKSAMLWYKSYRDAMKRKPKEKKPEQKEKPKKRFPSLLKKTKKQPKQEKVEALVPVDNRSKDKALAKIQREQEKQLRKMKEK